MSCVIKTLTPFLNKEALCQALKEVGCNWRFDGDKIITDRKDVRLGFQEFNKNKVGVWVLSAYSHTDKNQAEFVKQVETKYNELCPQMLQDLKNRLEEIQNKENYSEEVSQLKNEITRIEQERQAFVEKQKVNIIAEAKEMGYSVKEQKVKEKIKLVLVRNTY